MALLRKQQIARNTKILTIKAKRQSYGKIEATMLIFIAYLLCNLLHARPCAHTVKILARFETKNISCYASVLVRQGFSSILHCKIKNIKILEMLRLL